MSVGKKALFIQKIRQNPTTSLRAQKSYYLL